MNVAPRVSTMVFVAVVARLTSTLRMEGSIPALQYFVSFRSSLPLMPSLLNSKLNCRIQETPHIVLRDK